MSIPRRIYRLERFIGGEWQHVCYGLTPEGAMRAMLSAETVNEVIVGLLTAERYRVIGYVRDGNPPREVKVQR